MKSELFSWQQSWQETSQLKEAALVIYFASPTLIRQMDVAALLHERYPKARTIGCSTGGEIYGIDVIDNSVSGVALTFDHSRFDIINASVVPEADRQMGADMAKQLLQDDLKLVFVLSDGLNVNGSALVRGFKDVLPTEVLLTGGLAGDGPDFGETYVGVDTQPKPMQVAALALYGDNLHCSSGCMGGWRVFGPLRTITRSQNNILYELDGSPALDLYKHYLGEEAKELPGSALLYPLAIRAPESPDQDIVRTIVGIDEESKSLIFAGDVPENYTAQLMTSNFIQLADGAQTSAQQAQPPADVEVSLALLVSCIGRKLLMGAIVADEVDAIKSALPTTALSGFYSYGEIAPHGFTGDCQMHNQTMTITTLWER